MPELKRRPKAKRAPAYRISKLHIGMSVSWVVIVINPDGSQDLLRSHPTEGQAQAELTSSSEWQPRVSGQLIDLDRPDLCRAS